jgi:cytochrome P450
VIDSADAACRDFQLHDPRFARDQSPAYQQLRENCPVLHSDEYFPEHGRGGFWLLTRYEDVNRAATDYETFTSSVPGVTAIPMVVQRDYQQLPIEIDPPEHTRYRHLISPVFRRSRIHAMRQRMEAFASDLINKAGEHSNGVDLFASFAAAFSLRTLSTFMQLPAADEPLWYGWVHRMFGSVSDVADAKAATAEFHAYIDGLVAERLAEPHDDFIGMLASSELDGERLPAEEIRAFCAVVLVAGHETSASAMAVTLEYLARHPDVLERLRTDPGLIPSAVEEFLRYASPIQTLARNATREVELHGQVIEPGAVVGLCYGSANRDPAAFDDPEQIVLDRRPNRHMAFGAGPHMCVGAHVARLEMSIMLEQFAAQVSELRLIADDPPEWQLRGDRRGLVRLPVVVKLMT